MRKWNKLSTFILAVPLLVLSACGGGSGGGSASSPSPTPSSAPNEGETGQVYEIGITQIVEHPSLDATREGFLAALADNGFVEGDNLKVDYQNAQNDQNNAMTIAQKFASDNKDLVLAIATPSAQAVVQQVQNSPAMFAAVTDPLDAKLVQDMEKPGGNVTGAADYNPESTVKLMEFIAEELPHIQTVGAIVNEGEVNATIIVKRAEEVLAEHGITLTRAAVTNTSEVRQAAESLVGRADAFFVALDNTVVSALDSILQVSEANNIPLFSSDRDTVEGGAVAAFGFSYYDHGYQAGETAAEILNGANPGDLAVTVPDQLDLIFNVEAAAKQGIEVTDSIRAKVTNAENLLNDN
ncbi:ABC transporter substrate-binding protein [Paenibacillus senegalensis]|uniref:ABC transporter substrate-binding protein n=1 Tax=Paenibacillus senegalensis TaxID=1465766 RepID=UPI00028889F3|nr:ABC transporter substrate-binding protein [Paenibacillus senegalensis]